MGIEAAQIRGTVDGETVGCTNLDLKGRWALEMCQRVSLVRHDRLEQKTNLLCLGLAKGKFEYKLSITCTIVVGWYVGGDGRCGFVINSDGVRIELSNVGRGHGGA